MPRFTARFVPVLLLGVLGLVVTGQESVPPKKAPSIPIPTTLPRIAPREPADSQKQFQVTPGFRVELVAAEPLVQSPVAAEFDEQGRLFVVELPEYNQYASGKPQGKGRVVCLADTDGDGQMDRRTVFANDLDYPTALFPWDGGWFVGAAPDLWYFKDTDADGKADVKRKILTGFGRDKAGEGQLNSFRWHPEQRILISTGLDGGAILSVDKKDRQPVSVRSLNILLDPRTMTWEVTTGGGQHGMSLDDWGRMFVCGNSDPAHLGMYDVRYLIRNPYAQAPPAAVNIAPNGKFTKLHRISEVEPWRDLRTRLRKEGVVPGSDEGGQPSGFFTGATGITLYRGDAYPEAYRGTLFVGEVANNLIFHARLSPKGVGLVAERVEKESEFLASKDIWFRPVQFTHGPDGCLYVLDMYRELIEGAAFLAPPILKHVDPSAGFDRGRIWRIVPENFKPRESPRLGAATSRELVDLLDHANGWHRDTAARLLYQRQDREVIDALRLKARNARSAIGRSTALHALLGLNAITPADVIAALRDPHPELRIRALVLAERFSEDAGVRAQVALLRDDPERRVRYQLAFSLGSFAGGEFTRVLAALPGHDGADAWLQVAILSAARDRRIDLFRALSAETSRRNEPARQALLLGLAQQIAAAQRKSELLELSGMLNDWPETDRTLREHVVRAVITKLPPNLRSSFTQTGKTEAILKEMITEAVRQARTGKVGSNEQLAAVQTLHLAPWADAEPALRACLKPTMPQTLQRAALDALGRFDRPEVATTVLDGWTGFSPLIRSTAGETLLSRTVWVEKLLEAIEQGKVARTDLDPQWMERLRQHSDAAIRKRAEKVFAGITLARRADVVAAYQKALELKGDVERGRAVFKKNCASCHRLEGVGESVGADLSAIRDRGLEAVLLNILDPNREVKPQFVTYIVSLQSGRSVSGLITAETPNNITLRRVDGVSEILTRSEIDTLRSSGLSFMPEGLEKQIDIPAMADLLAYLNAVKER